MAETSHPAYEASWQAAESIATRMGASASMTPAHIDHEVAIYRVEGQPSEPLPQAGEIPLWVCVQHGARDPEDRAPVLIYASPSPDHTHNGATVLDRFSLPWGTDTLDVQIPAHVLRDRPDGVSPMQAICHHLCEDEAGPELSQADAARVLGIDARNVWTHLDRYD